MFVSWWALNTDGSYRAPLPDLTAWALSPVVHSPGAAFVEYPAAGRGFDILRENVTAERDLEVAAWVDGSAASARHVILNTSDGDDIAEGAIWRFAGNFLLVLLEEALVWPRTSVAQPPTGPAPTTDLAAFRVYAASAGQILATLLQEAQARGALTGLTWSFTNSVDSFGTTWSKRTTLKIAPGTTILKVAQQLAQAGMCEFDLIRQNGQLRLLMWEPGTRGVDRTLGPTPLILRRGRDLTDSPRKHTTRPAGTALLAVGGEGLYRSQEDATARARRGRRIERAASQGSITDDGTLQAYLQARLPAVTAGQMEVGHGIAIVPGARRPLVDYDIPDWVWSDTGRGLERLRLGQLTLKGDESGLVAAGASLNDLIADNLERLAQRIDGLEGGDTIAGTSDAPSGQDEPTDVVPPAAPTGLVAQSIAYQDEENAQTLAAVTVEWAVVTTNAAGPATAPAQAAQAILTRMQPGQSIAEDWTWPGAPTVVRAQNDTLLNAYDASGSTDPQAWLAAYVAANSQSATAADDVAGYRVRYAYLGLAQVGGPTTPPGSLLNWLEGTPPAGTTDSRCTFSGVEAGAAIAIQVAAYDDSGNQSAWSSTLEHDTAVDNIPPPVPSAATVSVYLGQLRYGWDGFGAEGEVMPSDLDRVEAFGSPENNFAAATLLDAFSVVAGQRVATDLPYDVEYFIWLVAVDRAGNRSAPSAVASAVPAAIGYGDIAFSQVGNMVEDGSFETLSGRDRHAARSVAAWTFTDATSPPAAHDSWYARGQGTVGSGIRPLVLSGLMPAVEGQQFVFRLAVRRAAANGSLLVRITFHLANGTTTTLQVTYTSAETADTWLDKTPSYYTAPAGTVAAELSVALAADCTAGAWLVDRVECREAIGTLLVQNAAITDAKVSTLSVGKLTAGTMSADVTLSGIFRTGTAGKRMEIDANGWRSYKTDGLTKFAELSLATETMLMTGTYQSGLAGERIHILPDGTFRMYGASGSDYAEIANSSGVVRMRSRADGSGRRSYVDFDPTGFLAYYGVAGGTIRSQFSTGLTYAILTGPAIGVRVDRRFSPDDGTANRFFLVSSSNGLPSGDSGNSVLHYEGRSSDSLAAIYGPGRSGLLWATGAIGVIGGSAGAGNGPIVASAYNNPSSTVTVKRNIRDPKFGPHDSVDVFRGALAMAYDYLPGIVEDDYPRFGPMVEDLQAFSEDLVRPNPMRTGSLTYAWDTLVGLLCRAMAELSEEVEQLKVGKPVAPRSPLGQIPGGRWSVALPEQLEATDVG